MSTPLENANRAYDVGDFATARALYETLAREGHPCTLVRLARMYIDGEGGGVDLQRAEALLDQAIALGVKEGVLQKAALFQARGDAAGYFEFIRKASDIGILPAQYQLGLCYASGNGVSLDTVRALEVMRAASERGHLGARIFLARQLLKNPLRPVDFFTGLFWLMSATLQSIYLIFHDPPDQCPDVFSRQALPASRLRSQTLR